MSLNTRNDSSPPDTAADEEIAQLVRLPNPQSAASNLH
jgi:hypothetical protein